MSDQAALWVLFALLSIALVLVIVTARRGLWEGQITSSAHFTDADKGQKITGVGIPDGAYIYRVDSPTQVTLRSRRKPEEIFLGMVTLDAGVDPLWGKNGPESWS